MSEAFSLAVNIRGDAKFMNKLKELGGLEALSFKEALEKAGDELVAYYGGQVFEGQGNVFGTPWRSLSPRTVAFKERHFRQYSAVPLMATGTMRESFTRTATELHLEVGNSAPYFKYHQSTAPRTKIPRRPMIAINDDVKDIVRDAVREKMIEILEVV